MASQARRLANPGSGPSVPAGRSSSGLNLVSSGCRSFTRCGKCPAAIGSANADATVYVYRATNDGTGWSVATKHATLVADGVQQQTGAPVTLRNFAAAGSTAEDGRWVAADAAAQVPDLVVVAFGMNDACYADADEFAASLLAIIERVGDTAAEAEFLLVTPMLPTPATTWVEHARFPAYREAMQALVRPGIALADVMTMWEAVLTRKDPQDLSGNGSNHPNDFGHRLYAQVILERLLASRP